MFDKFIEEFDTTDFEQQFPVELLSDSSQARKEYFYKYTLSHANLEFAREKIWRAVRNAVEQQVINLIGPSGVGKTTLLDRLEALILQTEEHNMLSNPGYIPVIQVEAGAPERGSFDWKQDLYWDILKKLNQEFINEYSRRAKSPSTQLVSDAVQEAIINRETKYLIIDEAQHIGIGARNNEKRENQMDVLKSITNKTKCNIILAGTYKFRELLNLNEQLSRRSVPVHFQRYQLSKPDDIGEFLEILINFQSEMPVPQMPNLLENTQELYEACLGCIGILKPILYKALADAIDDNAETVTQEYIYPHIPTLKQRKKMLNEILDGELEMEESNEDLIEFSESLRLAHTTKQMKKAAIQTETEEQTSSKGIASEKKAGKQSSSKRKPGRRSPTRDHVENGEVTHVTK